jgi:hypothetical protein
MRFWMMRRIVYNAESTPTPHTSVDMSKWVAYSLPPRVLKKLHNHDVGLILVTTTSLYSFIL